MKVSVIIPVYNVSDYIERCIRSVMNQTYRDIECIIVDDATPDDSIAQCEQMIAAYHGPIRFSILHHPKNRGLSAARNTGTAAATGDYLYYLDSDDEITQDCIKILLNKIEENDDVDIVQGCHIEEEDGKEEVFIKIASSIKISNRVDIDTHYFKYHHIICPAWNKLIKRSFVERYQLYFEEGILHEDKLWFFYVVKHLKHIFICKDITYIYHVRPQSIITKGKNEAAGKSILYIYNDILSHLTKGWERNELGGYVYGFCKPYCMYLNDVSALKDTFRLYREQTKRYHCWHAYIILTIVGGVCQLGNPLRVLKLLHIVRWRLMELPDILFKTNSK